MEQNLQNLLDESERAGAANDDVETPCRDCRNKREIVTRTAITKPSHATTSFNVKPRAILLTSQKCKLKCRAGTIVGCGPEVPAVTFHNRTTDR